MLLTGVNKFYLGDIFATFITFSLIIAFIVLVAYVVHQNKKQKQRNHKNQADFEIQMQQLQRDIDSLQSEINKLQK